MNAAGGKFLHSRYTWRDPPQYQAENHKKEGFFLEAASYWRVCIGGGEGEEGEEFLCCHPDHAKGGEAGDSGLVVVTPPSRAGPFSYIRCSV
jgi:hypothetical protein